VVLLNVPQHTSVPPQSPALAQLMLTPPHTSPNVHEYL
jgi:hypothetical protein